MLFYATLDILALEVFKFFVFITAAAPRRGEPISEQSVVSEHKYADGGHETE